MAVSVFRWVDPDDTSSVLLDMRALASGSTGFDLVGDIDLGMTDAEALWIEQDPKPGAVQASVRHPVTEMSFNLYGKHSSVPNLLALWRDLAYECARGGLIEWQPDGASEAMFLEIYPSPIPQAIRGTDGGLAQFIRTLQTPVPGIPVKLWRHPYVRYPAATQGPFTVTNQLNAREFQITNTGTAPALCKVRTIPEAGAKFGQERIAIKSKGNLTEFATLYGFECEGATLYTDTTSTTSATGYSGTGAAGVSFATATMVRRFKKVITPSDETALEGHHDLQVRVKPYGGATLGEYDVQLKFGYSDTDPLPFAGDVKRWDFSDVDSIDWIEKSLGEVNLGKGGGSLVIEVWAERISGDYSLAFDFAHLYPCDESTTIASVPGLRVGKWGKQSWRGDALDVTNANVLGGESNGDIREDSARVNALDEVVASPGLVAGTPKTGGLSLAAGVYVAEIDASIYTASGAQVTVGRFQVVANDAGAGAWQVRKSVALKSQKNRTKKDRTLRFAFTVTSTDVTNSVKFALRTKQTAATADGRKILTHRMRLTFLYTVTENHTLTLDGPGNMAAAITTATGATAFSIPHPEGVPFPEAPVGTSTWVCQWGDIPTDPGYEQIDLFEPTARSVLARSATVYVDLTRRDLV